MSNHCSRLRRLPLLLVISTRASRATARPAKPASYPTGEATPSPGELVQGPATVFVLGLVGLALGRWVPTRWLIPMLVPVVFAYWIAISWGLESDLRWFLPFTDVGQLVAWAQVGENGGIPVVRGWDTTALAWHLLYLAGVGALLTAALVSSLSRARRSAIVGLAAVAVVLGGSLQVTTAVGNLPS